MKNIAYKSNPYLLNSIKYIDVPNFTGTKKKVKLTKQ